MAALVRMPGMARHDVLTGLANRAEFNAKLEEASKRLRRNGGAVTVMMLDLDKFKAVNDTLGHPAGDRLLVEVAQRLRSTIRETDVLARLGGDEFAIIQEGGPNQHEGAIALALRIINVIAQPFDLNGHQASVGTSIGIVLAPENGVEPEELLKRADLALYDAKANGRNDFRLFQAEMLEVAYTQKSAENELRDAIARDEFELLAFDDAIEVAGPVLLHCERLDANALLENAKTKSQNHLLAISGRKTLVEAVTDVLVERGNQTVVSSTARNSGARFSDFGISSLIKKARDDGDLALCVWSRPDIPRQNLVKLFVEASETLKNQLVEADPRRAELIRTAIAEASDQIQTKARAGSNDFAQARSYVKSLHSSGKLDEAQLDTFANEGSFDKVTVALSLMCDLPIGLVERALVQNQTEQILVLAKAINLSWVTTVALLLLQAGVNGSSRQHLDQCFASFSRLQPDCANRPPVLSNEGEGKPLDCVTLRDKTHYSLDSLVPSRKPDLLCVPKTISEFIR